MKKKKRRSISLSARAAIALILLSLSTLSGWRDVAIYFGAKSGNTETVTAECIAVQSSRTDELRQHTPYRMLYVLTLQDETKVAVSKLSRRFRHWKTADSILSSESRSHAPTSEDRRFPTENLPFFP